MTTSRALDLALGAWIALCATGRTAASQVGATAGAFVAPTEHRVDAGFGLERSFGLTFGAEGTVHVRPWLDADLHLQGGTLWSDDAGVVDRDLAELGAQARVRPVTWLAFTVGATRRTYSSVIARQRWTLLSVGTEIRLSFSGGATSGVLRVAALPVVDVNGLGDANAGFSVAAGMEYRRDRLEAVLWYSLERYEWPAGVGGRRLEQLAALTLVLRARVLGG
ncbi:MAG: hypothetical protein ACREMR_01175 [Gemmatimonadales bacterium]